MVQTRGRSRAETLFLALVLLTIAVGAIAFELIASSRAVLRDGFESRIDLQSLLQATVDQETGMRGYVASGSEIFLQPYVQGTSAYGAALRSLRGHLVQPRLSPLRGIADQFDAEHVQWIDRVVHPLVEAPRRSDRVSLEIDGKRDVDRMRALAARGQSAANGAIDAGSTSAQQTIIGSIAAIVFLTIVLGTAAMRNLQSQYHAEQRLRAEIAERNVALEQSNQALQEFAYVASHDLQEPLRTVASFTQLLQKRYAGILDAQADEYIAFAVDGARRMQTLINDILQFSRITTHGKAFERVELHDVVDRAIGNLRGTIDERHAGVFVGRLPQIAGDAGQLTQVFQNLIGNGIKYNVSVPPRVEVRAELNHDAVTVHVEDNGIGIHPEYHDRVFRIFSRLHTREEYPGTGIGLAICKRIIERHGGRIWLESSEGQGARFSFTLPRVGE